MKIDTGDILRRVTVAAMWVAAVAYIVFAADAARKYRSAQTVTRIEVAVVDSTANGYLVTGPTVRSWIARSGIKTIGEGVGTVDLAALERVIAGNGFVDRVRAYVASSGVLTVEVSQRRPTVRLRFDGYDSYADARGQVFPAPRMSSLYLPVVTGSYRPPFAADYSGYLADAAESRAGKSRAAIDTLEHEKYPHYRKYREWRDSLKRYGRQYVSQRLLESDDAFAARVEAKRAENASYRRRYEYRMRVEQQAVDRIEARQQAEREAQKKLEKSYEDFSKLITFVERLERDDFWRAEIVQIEVSSTSAGEPELRLVPRSGDFTILFGPLGSRRDNDEKLARLMTFYKKGLARTGWNEFKTVNVKYKGQVVCAK